MRNDRLLSSEALLRGVGVALAAGSLAFATREVSRSSTEPDIAGLEHLAIYAKPTSRAPQPRRQDREIDYMPVGVTHSRAASAMLGAYEVVEASSDAALVRLPEGRVQRVTPGAHIAGLGVVTAIRQSAQKWIVVTQAGIIHDH
jgi:hypothetical protein